MKATKDMTFSELIEKFPKAAGILSNKGMHCVGCVMARMETVEQGCKAHGMSDEDVEAIIDEINSSSFHEK